MRFAFDLWSHEDVAGHAGAILDRLRAGTMPCDGAWARGPGRRLRTLDRLGKGRMKQVGGTFVVTASWRAASQDQWETAAGAPGSREALAGYLYEADDLDAAIERASKIPAARMGGSVEVRPLKEQ